MKIITRIIARIHEEADKKCKIAYSDYVKGKEDCKAGVYDKWYRYNRENDGEAYNCGWNEQNKKTKNESIKFIETNKLC